MIPETLIQQIATANDIVDVISGYFPLKRAGTVYKALCPFHRERTPSFTVNPARQTFKCFGCDAGGTVFRFVELYENVNFPEAARRLAGRRGIPFQEAPLTPEENARQHLHKRLRSLHADVAEAYHRNLLRAPVAEHARAYLKGRGISIDVARSWKLGYAPEAWDFVAQTGRKLGYTDHELIESGLVTIKEDEGGSRSRSPHFYDRFRDRLMFPICNDTGEVIAFSGRVLSAEAFGGKYVNSPETPIYKKGKTLFGLHKSKRPLIDAESAIICEGQIDLISAFESGVTNITAPLGTAFTVFQASILKRYVREVVLCFDSDTAGIKAAERSLPALLDAGLAVRFAEMPEGHDPDSFIREQGPEAFRQRVAEARDFFEFLADRLADHADFRTPKGKMVATHRMAELVALITDPVMREAVVRSVSARLEIGMEQFLTLIAKPKNRRAFDEPADDPLEEESSAAAIPLAPMSRAVKMLCQLLLAHPEVLDWLRTLEWSELLAHFPDGELPALLLRSSFTPGNAPSIATLMTQLSIAEQSALAGLLDSIDAVENLADPQRVAAECWAALERQMLEDQREILSARLRRSGLSDDDITRLQKQVLDLTHRLTHIARPLPTPP